MYTASRSQGRDSQVGSKESATADVHERMSDRRTDERPSGLPPFPFMLPCISCKAGKRDVTVNVKAKDWVLPTWYVIHVASGTAMSSVTVQDSA